MLRIPRSLLPREISKHFNYIVQCNTRVIFRIVFSLSFGDNFYYLSMPVYCTKMSNNTSRLHSKLATKIKEKTSNLEIVHSHTRKHTNTHRITYVHQYFYAHTNTQFTLVMFKLPNFNYAEILFHFVYFPTY